MQLKHLLTFYVVIVGRLQHHLARFFINLSFSGSYFHSASFCSVTMPKDRRSRSMSFERHFRASPYSCSSSTHQNSSLSATSSSKHHQVEPSVKSVDTKEWEEACCPVCMEHPHNAVLLLCSCYEKGCRAYMCDTSYRHSNCLDQFCKSSSEENATDQPQKVMKLVCPLCRGSVNGWIVVQDARHYMDAKVRSCSTESCGYSGTYADLRKHARIEHPSMRPTEADPERQHDWRRMVRRREIGDVLSSIQSALCMEDTYGDNGFVSLSPSSNFTVYLVVQVLGQSFNPTTTRVPSRVRTRRRRRYFPLWGEANDAELLDATDRVAVRRYLDENTTANEANDAELLNSTNRVAFRGYLDENTTADEANDAEFLTSTGGWPDDTSFVSSPQDGQERETRRRRTWTQDEDLL